MKIVIETQHRENYGWADGNVGENARWKYKGGNTYVVEGISAAQAADKALWARLEDHVTSYSDAFEEYVIGSSLHDDCEANSEFCEHWEQPIVVWLDDQGRVLKQRERLFDFVGKSHGPKGCGAPIGERRVWLPNSDKSQLWYFYKNGVEEPYQHWHHRQMLAKVVGEFARAA